jgi:hypothetical protein
MICCTNRQGRSACVTTQLRKIFLLCASIVLGAGPALAQPVITVHRSIELRVVQAEFVVRGTISDLARTVVVPPDGYVTNWVRIDGEERSYRTQIPDGKVTYVITVKVDEVIKGPRRAAAEFVVETSARDDEFERWAARRASFLCFGNRSERTNNETMPPYWNVIALDPPVPGEQTIGGMVDFPPIFSMDFARLDHSEEILSRARKFRKEKSLKTHVFEYPPLFPELLWARLAAPVTPSLERTARHLLNSPEDFFAQNPAPNTRQRTRRHASRGRHCGTALFQVEAEYQVAQSVAGRPGLHDHT